MASVASRPRTLPGLRALPVELVVPALVVLGLTAVSLFLRTYSLGESLWMDEGLSIGIASQPLFDIPSTLRVDGSPPLYYMLLSVWMDLFGDGPGETQGLSVLISLLSIPSALWAGWTLFGRRAGYMAAALFAFNGFLTLYAQETRMYALMVVLGLLLTALFLHIYVYRRRRYLPAFAAVLALMLYTHNWAVFVIAGALIALGVLWLGSDERGALVRDGLIGFGAAFVLYIPWLPTLAHQVQHTGAPWLNPPRFGAPVQISKSLLNGGTATVALLLGGGSGLAVLWRDRARTQERRAIMALVSLCLGMLAVAWIVSQASPAWTTRYLGVTLGPILLLAALGLSRAGNLGLVALLIVLGIWAVPKTYDLRHKSNASDLRVAVAQGDLLHRGDLVISMQPEQTPLLKYHLETLGPADGLRYATPLGPVKNPDVMDWTDSQDRLERATVTANLEPLLANLPRSARVLLVHPVTTRVDDWDAPWTELVRRRSAQWGQALLTDRRFKLIAAVPQVYNRATRIGVRGVIYEKTG